MRAQLAMEEAQRSKGEGADISGLNPQEEERRRAMQREDPYRGLGETQKAQMAMWGKEGSQRPPTEEEQRAMGQERRQYPAGTGSVYHDPKMTTRESASSGESFTGGPSLTGGEVRRIETGQASYPAGTGSVYHDPKMTTRERASSGESFTGGPRMSEEEARRKEAEYPRYAAGTGSVYRDPNMTTRERASSGESFTGGAQFTEGGPRPSGAERGAYSAGTGSVYRDPNMATRERASTGESFTGGMKYAEEEAWERRQAQPAGTGAEREMPREPPTGMTETSMAGKATATAKGVGGDIKSTTKDVTHKVTSKAKELEKSSPEDMANRAGLIIGKAIRKTVAVTKEMGSGLRKGLGREHEESAPEQRAQYEERRTAAPPEEYQRTQSVHEEVREVPPSREVPSGEVQRTKREVRTEENR
ncbi:MAG: hypothetical protein ISF22_05770 [Methanomassiliicoccus sp.]|nr:hypothetical protein [Methanomassiliicoccus sp.]